MKVTFNKEEIYDYYVADEESDMDDVYDIFSDYFGNNSQNSPWTLEGTWLEIETTLKIIMKKYPMDYILNRFINSGLAYKTEN